MVLTRALKPDSVVVGKTLADAVGVSVAGYRGMRFFVPTGSDLGGKSIAVYEVGPDGADYVAETSRTDQPVTFTLTAGRSRDIDPGINAAATLKFVCATATAAQTAAYLRGKR